MLVTFTVLKQPNASVIWLNRRWLLKNGFDVDDADVRREVERDLIKTFAFITTKATPATPGDPPDLQTTSSDRYGSERGTSRHGGSGRVASVGCYQVKGIGRTPLVGNDPDISHTHGSCWLEEAAREAIFSEIFEAESPHGALAVIGILDLAIQEPPSKEPLGPSGRRVLLIRETPFRFAHLLRAPLFTPLGSTRVADPQTDVARVAEAIEWVTNPTRNHNAAQSLVDIGLEKLAEQIAFTVIWRLYPGAPFASNVSIDGKLLDFGTARPLAQAGRSGGLPGGVGPEDAAFVLDLLVREVVHTLARFRNQPVDVANHAATIVRNHLIQSLVDESRKVAQPYNPEIRDLLASELAQGCEVYLGLRHELAKPARHVSSHVNAACKDMPFTSGLNQLALSDEPVWFGRSDIRRRTSYRKSLDVDELQVTLKQAANCDVARIIDTKIAEGRRSWRCLNADWVVLAHTSTPTGSVVLVRNHGKQVDSIWIDAVGFRGGLYVLDVYLRLDQLGQTSMTECTCGRWHGTTNTFSFRARKCWFKLGEVEGEAQLDWL